MAEREMPQTTDTTHSDPAAAADDEALRRKLLSRIAVAGVTIVGLLGGLAVYDSLNRPEAPALPKMAAAPAEPTEDKAAQKSEEKPAEEKPAEQAAEEKPVETQATATPAVPERTETPVAAPTAEEKAPKAAKPVTPPAAAVATAIKPPERAAAPPKPDARHEIARVMPEETRPASRTQQARPPAHAPASRPLTQAAEAAKRFLVQVGVFSNHQNAEELVARLTEAGIPARIESHVQVGPFASRAEVEAARVKLKALGIDDGLLVRR